MKKTLTILFVFTCFFASAQKLDSIRGAGFIWERGMFNKSLGIPTVCGVPKTNYNDSTKKAQIIYDSCAGKFYAYNPATESWAEPGGGGVSGVDSVTIVQTGCAFTFYTWQAGVSTAVGTLSQYSGLTPRTGLVTHTSGLTFTVTAAVYAIDCVTYVTRDTTITLPAAGDTGRIDVIKVNTSSVTTYGQGVEGEALPLPSLSSTELALTYILVTDTGVFVSPPADTALWVSVGNEIRNANTGRVRVKRDLQVGNYTPGAWDTTGVHTNTYMVAQDGFYLTNPANSSLTKTGIGQGFGNAANMWAGSNIIGTWSLVGNGTGNQFRIFGGMNPSTGTGEGNGVLIDPALSPSGANSKSYNMLKIAPTYTQGVLGTGTLRGIYYNPILTSLNTSPHYFIEATSGLVKLAGITAEVDTATWKPMAMNSSGDVRKFSYWPAGSGGGGSQNLSSVLTEGNTASNFMQIDSLKLYDLPNDAYGSISINDHAYTFKDASTDNAMILDNQYASITVFRSPNGTGWQISDIGDSLTASQNYQVPNKSGTIALLSDITGSTSDTIYVDAPLEAYTSGDSNKIRINPDTLVKWRYGLEKTFTGIDLTSADYNITEPGIYVIEHGSSDGSFVINLPDPDLFVGGKITIINNDGADNYAGPYGSNAPKKAGGSALWTEIGFSDMQVMISVGGVWRSGQLTFF